MKLSAVKPTGRYTSRKFWTMAVAQITWILLLLYDKVESQIFYDLTMLTLGLFFLSNVAQKFLGKSDANERSDER